MLGDHHHVFVDAASPVAGDGVGEGAPADGGEDTDSSSAAPWFDAANGIAADATLDADELLHSTAEDGWPLSFGTGVSDEAGPTPDPLELPRPTGLRVPAQPFNQESVPIGNGWARLPRDRNTELHLGGRKSVEIMLADHRFKLRFSSRQKLIDSSRRVY